MKASSFYSDESISGSTSGESTCVDRNDSEGDSYDAGHTIRCKRATANTNLLEMGEITGEGRLAKSSTDNVASGSRVTEKTTDLEAAVHKSKGPPSKIKSSKTAVNDKEKHPCCSKKSEKSANNNTIHTSGTPEIELKRCVNHNLNHTLVSPGGGRRRRPHRSVYPPPVVDYGMPDDELTDSSDSSSSDFEFVTEEVSRPTEPGVEAGHHAPYIPLDFPNPEDTHEDDIREDIREPEVQPVENQRVLYNWERLVVMSSARMDNTNGGESGQDTPADWSTSTDDVSYSTNIVAGGIASELGHSRAGNSGDISTVSEEFASCATSIRNQSDTNLRQHIIIFDKASYTVCEGETINTIQHLHLQPKEKSIEPNDTIPLPKSLYGEPNRALTGISSLTNFNENEITISPSKDFLTVDHNGGYELVLSSSERTDEEADELLQAVITGSTDIGLGSTMTAEIEKKYAIPFTSDLQVNSSKASMSSVDSRDNSNTLIAHYNTSNSCLEEDEEHDEKECDSNVDNLFNVVIGTERKCIISTPIKNIQDDKLTYEDDNNCESEVDIVYQSYQIESASHHSELSMPVVKSCSFQVESGSGLNGESESKSAFETGHQPSCNNKSSLVETECYSHVDCYSRQTEDTHIFKDHNVKSIFTQSDCVPDLISLDINARSNNPLSDHIPLEDNGTLSSSLHDHISPAHDNTSKDSLTVTESGISQEATRHDKNFNYNDQTCNNFFTTLTSLIEDNDNDTFPGAFSQEHESSDCGEDIDSHEQEITDMLMCQQNQPESDVTEATSHVTEPTKCVNQYEDKAQEFNNRSINSQFSTDIQRNFDTAERHPSMYYNPECVDVLFEKIPNKSSVEWESLPHASCPLSGNYYPTNNQSDEIITVSTEKCSDNNDLIHIDPNLSNMQTEQICSNSITDDIVSNICEQFESQNQQPPEHKAFQSSAADQANEQHNEKDDTACTECEHKNITLYPDDSNLQSHVTSNSCNIYSVEIQCKSNEASHLNFNNEADTVKVTEHCNNNINLNKGDIFPETQYNIEYHSSDMRITVNDGASNTHLANELQADDVITDDTHSRPDFHDDNNIGNYLRLISYPEECETDEASNHSTDKEVKLYDDEKKQSLFSGHDFGISSEKSLVANSFMCKNELKSRRPFRTIDTSFSVKPLPPLKSTIYSSKHLTPEERYGFQSLEDKGMCNKRIADGHLSSNIINNYCNRDNKSEAGVTVEEFIDKVCNEMDSSLQSASLKYFLPSPSTDDVSGPQLAGRDATVEEKQSARNLSPELPHSPRDSGKTTREKNIIINESAKPKGDNKDVTTDMRKESGGSLLRVASSDSLYGGPVLRGRLAQIALHEDIGDNKDVIKDVIKDVKTTIKDSRDSIEKLGGGDGKLGWERTEAEDREERRILERIKRSERCERRRLERYQKDEKSSTADTLGRENRKYLLRTPKVTRSGQAMGDFSRKNTLTDGPDSVTAGLRRMLSSQHRTPDACRCPPLSRAKLEPFKMYNHKQQKSIKSMTMAEYNRYQADKRMSESLVKINKSKLKVDCHLDPRIMDTSYRAHLASRKRMSEHSKVARENLKFMEKMQEPKSQYTRESHLNDFKKNYGAMVKQGRHPEAWAPTKGVRALQVRSKVETV